MALVNSLVTVPDVRSYLGDATADHDRAEFLANAYSRAIHRYTKRQWLPAETNGVKLFAYEGHGHLSLAPYELRAVTSIVLYNDLPTDSQWTLAAGSSTVESDYRLEPRNKTLEDTYLWLILPKVSLTEARYLKGTEVKITGDWGVGTTKIPHDVKLACLIAIANAWTSPEGFGSRSLGELSVSEVPEEPDQEGRSLPPDARALLTDYRREAYL